MSLSRQVSSIPSQRERYTAPGIYDSNFDDIHGHYSSEENRRKCRKPGSILSVFSNSLDGRANHLASRRVSFAHLPDVREFVVDSGGSATAAASLLNHAWPCG